jgi:hypothetical protein
MKISEQHLSLAQHRALDRLRLLTLTIMWRGRFRRCCNDFGA